MITLPIAPVSKPRQTQRDRWQQRDRVMRYRSFADQLRALMRNTPLDPSKEWKIEFIIPMPPSWSKKKRAEMDGKPHQQKPDHDNLDKAFWDALLKEDAEVWSVWIVKRWGLKGEIRIHEIKEN